MKETLIINKILKSKEETKKLIEDLTIYFYENIGEDGCFDKEITFKFNKKDLYRHRMNINRFLVQMILFEPFAGRGIKLDKSFIEKKLNALTNGVLADYYNDKIIDTIMEHDVDIDMIELNVIVAEVQERLKKLVEDFSMIMGLTVSIRSIVDLCNENEEIDELITEYEPLKNASTKEIETDYNEKGAKLIQLMREANSVFKPLLEADEGIKLKQFQQFMQCIGFQSNMDGYTFPKPIESGYVNKGLQSASDYLLDATMGNKAQIYQKVYTGNSGYFSRRSTHAAIDSVLHADPNYDCKVNSENLIELFVANKKYLKIFDGLYYKEKRNSLAYKLLNCKDKKQNELVGQTIYIRSPLTCASEEGICHKCYGRLSRINKSRHIGIHSAETISSRLMQSILSTKHLLFTDSTTVNFPEVYKELFTLDANALVFDPAEAVKARGKNALFIRYSDRDLYISDTDDEKDGQSFVKSISKFSIVNNAGDVLYDIQEENGLELYLTQTLEDNVKSKVLSDEEEDDEEEYYDYLVPLNSLEAGDILFYIEVTSKEIKKPLKDITSVLDRKGHLGFNTLPEIVAKLADLFIDSKLDFKCSMVHLHVAMYGLVRSTEVIYKRPDFRKPVSEEEYTIMTIKESIYNSGSILVALSFERLGQLLKKPHMYYRSHKSSFIDPLFYEKYTSLEK